MGERPGRLQVLLAAQTRPPPVAANCLVEELRWERELEEDELR